MRRWMAWLMPLGWKRGRQLGSGWMPGWADKDPFMNGAEGLR